MIPKIIHYCWFGRGEMPKLMKKCLKSWKKYCPDWEIVRWDEDRFDVNSTPFTQQAYTARKYAFVSDYVRVKALNEMGGVYLDTDQELIQPLDSFLHHKAFLGFMNKSEVGSGLIGTEKGHPFTSLLLSYYNGRNFVNEDGSFDMTPNTRAMTNILMGKGLVIDDSYQIVSDVVVYPQTYFSPISCISVEHCCTEATVSLHHMYGSWHSEKGRRDMKRAKFRTTKLYHTWEAIRGFPRKLVKKILGDRMTQRIKERLNK